MLTDPLGDSFSRLRNGAKAGHETVRIPYSKIKEEVLLLLKKEGFLIDFEVEENKRTLAAHLKFEKSGTALLENIRRISKPGHRIYSPAPKSAKVRGGIGFQILSTSKGLMTDREALQQKIGGEILGEVW